VADPEAGGAAPLPRRLLDGLYWTGGVVAAVCLALIAVLILTQIVARYFGVLVPGALELAGYAMAASSFLALAYALRVGGHIRVSLVIQLMPARARRLCDLWSITVGTLLAGFFAWYVAEMVVTTWRFGDRTPGLLDIPLWIPQLSMLVGLVVLLTAFLDDLVQMLRGRPPSYEGKGEGVLVEGGDSPGGGR
jgi:TRAP-type C4-dicarboxylate transport system permease small subunit